MFSSIYKNNLACFAAGFRFGYGIFCWNSFLALTIARDFHWMLPGLHQVPPGQEQQLKLTPEIRGATSKTLQLRLNLKDPGCPAPPNPGPHYGKGDCAVIPITVNAGDNHPSVPHVCSHLGLREHGVWSSHCSGHARPSALGKKGFSSLCHGLWPVRKETQH